MSRERSTYADGGPSGVVTGCYQAEVPTEGYYRFRLKSGGHPVAIRVWYGAPLDPVTGEELDRSWRWQATANNAPIDLTRVWPNCGREPITQAEHDYLAGLQVWAAEHAPASPQANPHRRIDLLDAGTPLPF